MQADSSNSDKRKLLSAGSHGSIFISSLFVSIAIPLAILWISDDVVVKANAKEAINFHLNVWLIEAVIAVLSFFTLGLLGFVLVPFWLLYHWGMSIWAVYHCFNQPETAFRYPFILRIF